MRFLDAGQAGFPYFLREGLKHKPNRVDAIAQAGLRSQQFPGCCRSTIQSVSTNRAPTVAMSARTGRWVDIEIRYETVKVRKADDPYVLRVRWTALPWSMEKPFKIRAVVLQRLIVDPDDLGHSLSVHATGQSGHPTHRHYDDFIEPWRNVRYHPSLWYRVPEQLGADRLNEAVLFGRGEHNLDCLQRNGRMSESGLTKMRETAPAEKYFICPMHRRGGGD